MHKTWWCLALFGSWLLRVLQTVALRLWNCGRLTCLLPVITVRAVHACTCARQQQDVTARAGSDPGAIMLTQAFNHSIGFESLRQATWRLHARTFVSCLCGTGLCLGNSKQDTPA